MTQHGVLSTEGLLSIDVQSNRWVPIQVAVPGSLAGLCELALEHKLTHLWMMPDTKIVPDQALYDAIQEQWSAVGSWQYEKDFPLPEGVINQLIQVTARRKKVNQDRSFQPQVSICFPQNSHWDWGREPDLTPKELLRIVGYLEQALGVRVGAGPSAVGTRVLEKVLAKYPRWLEIPEIDLHTLPFGTNAAKNVIWDRLPTPEELDRLYLVKVDKNSAFPRACVEELFGDAHIEHVGGERYDHRYPGVWRISLQGEDRADLPPPLWESARVAAQKGEAWIATPIVKLLHKMDYPVQVHEGWAFGEEIINGKTIKHYHGVLKHWAELLWDIRKGFTDETRWKSPYARLAAQSAIKNILNMTIGVTSYAGYEQPTYQRRPDWNTQVVAGARAAMFYNILKFEREGYGTPVIVYIDALLYLSNNPLPFSDNRTSLGGYKHEWSLPMTDEVRDVLLGKRSRAKKLERLNDLAEVQAVAKDGKVL
jgi:hypothetical protein